MDLSFANPAGFWALLALPAILAIHFLQRQSRRVVTSTLFLFEALNPASARGRRVERLRHSLPLWLQLAAVCLLAWLLAGPRWLKKDSSQRVVVVLDSSVSMLAFRDELPRALAARLRALNRTAARTEWRLVESDPARPTLYAGDNLDALLATLPGWNPHLGTHDFTPALNAARSVARETGIALFVTDRRADVPEGVETLAVGRPIDNCGWVGVTVDGDKWRALVQNHSASPQTRAWHLEADGAAGPASTLTLAPQQIRTLAGTFPAGKDRCELVLDADAFALDDRLPIVRPEAKQLALFMDPGSALDDFLRRFVGSVADADPVTDPKKGDVQFVVKTLAAPGRPAVLFPPPAPDSTDYLPGELVAQNHPLTNGLVWNGLLVKKTDPIPSQEGDEALLWQGDRPLIFLRGGQGARVLCVNFDLKQSNADRLPAFVVLLNRFVEAARGEKVAFERLNTELNQPLAVAGDPAGPPPRGPDGDTNLRAPAAPGYFEVKQGDRALLAAAVHFADAREADFRDAATLDTLEGKSAKLVERNSREDFLWPVFALALGALFLANWAATARGGGGQAVGVGEGGLAR